MEDGKQPHLKVCGTGQSHSNVNICLFICLFLTVYLFFLFISTTVCFVSFKICMVSTSHSISFLISLPGSEKKPTVGAFDNKARWKLSLTNECEKTCFAPGLTLFAFNVTIRKSLLPLICYAIARTMLELTFFFEKRFIFPLCSISLLFIPL